MRFSRFSLLLLLYSLLCLFPSAHATLPDILVAIEPQLYQGTPEEVTAFIDKRQVLVDGLITLITSDLQTTKEEKDKVVFAALLDLYQGLSFQLKNLQAELARSESPFMPLPSLGSPPYNLTTFDEMVSYQQKAAQQLGLYEEMLTYGVARLATLKDELKEVSLQYARVKSDENSGVPAYEALAHILSLQHEYALLELKKPKVNKALGDMRGVAKEAGALVEQVFGKLQISKEDIADQKKRLDALNEDHAESLARLNGEYLDLNKQNVVIESKLDKTATALALEAKGDMRVEALESERERLELVSMAIKFRQRAITQEKMNLGFAIKSVMFRQEWLAVYVDVAAGRKSSGFVETWQKNEEELRVKQGALVKDLSLATQQRSDLTQRLVATAKTVASSSSVDSQTIFTKQAEKTKENLDVLIFGIADNVHDLTQLGENVELVLRLLRSRMDSSERFRSWGLEYLTKKWEQVSGVLFYPLLTMGDVSITLILICKVIVLVLIGVWMLKVIRRKTAMVLAEKTAMAPGAINSMTTLIYYISLVLGVFIVLSIIGFNVSQLGMIFGALGVGIGFGLQTVFNNFFSGILLLTEQTIQVGDYVQLQTGVDGEVRKISIRATIVRTFDGEDVIVPNSEFVSSRVNTWSFGDNWRRLKIPFGVAYGSDPEEVVRLAEEAAREVRITKEDTAHPLRIFFEGFGNNSLDFSIRPWCWMNQIHAQTGMISDYYFALFKKLKGAGIDIPFPQTDLHLKSISPEALAVLEKLVSGAGRNGAGETGSKGGE